MIPFQIHTESDMELSDVLCASSRDNVHSNNSRLPLVSPGCSATGIIAPPSSPTDLPSSPAPYADFKSKVC